MFNTLEDRTDVMELRQDKADIQIGLMQYDGKYKVAVHLSFPGRSTVEIYSQTGIKDEKEARYIYEKIAARYGFG